LFPLEDRPQQIANRTRVEILASILRVASSGALKTHIMYKANLSHRQLEKYLEFLEERGLIVMHTGDDTHGRTYCVTDKGLGFLREYSRLSEFLDEDFHKSNPPKARLLSQCRLR